MRFTLWILKATGTHSEHVILTAFLLPQWLHERATVLRYSTLPVLFINFLDTLSLTQAVVSIIE